MIIDESKINELIQSEVKAQVEKKMRLQKEIEEKYEYEKDIWYKDIAKSISCKSMQEDY
ncbi:hypothetical protein PQ478_09075 [Alkalihalophilus pseudofirmus]|uniref:hypothetical protein n=1 Tax=Alkalihalophilus pseudofirmus TaxID=79885 RepID=UPI00259B76B6|nr:hypothetical protein [Alkalihalophilus pseudofirmus]WEG18623.1 hypothetical protein PQ478_09075 [Alkalihalophilus pseudofirmus]